MDDETITIRFDDEADNDDEPVVEAPRQPEASDARRQRADDKAAARRAKQEARAERADRIVEAPREPRRSFVERRRQARSGAETGSSGGRTLALVAGTIGAIGFACSVVLAIGALLVALGVGDGNGAYDFLVSLCDALVGPLRDAFSFSGADAEMKESLVAWGAGSIGYLVIGVAAQSVLRAGGDD